jgi:aryl-alcohol dehydrogenase
MKTLAAVATESGKPLTLMELDIEDPREDEILVRIVATGVCHTDLVVQAGMLPVPMPVILGHEGAGVVEKIGSKVSKVKPGDHVVLSFNSCGSCESCKEKEPAYCYEFMPRNFGVTREDGTTALSMENSPVHSNFFGQSSFATFSICHELNAVKVPKTVDLSLLGPLGCGILTGAGAVINALPVKKGSSFLVYGTGSVGLSSVMAAQIQGASTIIAVDLIDDRLEMARELGATHTFNPNKTDNLVEKIIELTTHGVTTALDTTGLPDVIRDAVLCLAPRGTCGILGACPPDFEVKLNEFHFFSGGRKLIGIVEGSAYPDTMIPELINYFEEGQFPFDRLIKFYDFEHINQAIEDSENGKTIKAIVRM